MPKLPTVKLRNRRTGEKLIINETEYARDLSKWTKDWEVLSHRRGDATDAEVVAAQAADDLERTRRNDPVREHRFGDNRRTQEANRLTINTGPKDASEIRASLSEAEQKKFDALIEKHPQLAWDWERLRVYVRNLTGWTAVSRGHALLVLEQHATATQPKE